MNKPDLFKAAAESHDPAGPGLVKAGLLEQAIAFVRDFTAYAGIAGARAARLRSSPRHSMASVSFSWCRCCRL
jgi:hypothetical protein